MEDHQRDDELGRILTCVVQPEGEWQSSIDGLGRGERCPQMRERTVLGLWGGLRQENGRYTGGGRVQRQ